MKTDGWLLLDEKGIVRDGAYMNIAYARQAVKHWQQQVGINLRVVPGMFVDTSRAWVPRDVDYAGTNWLT